MASDLWESVSMIKINWSHYLNKVLAKEISNITCYFDQTIYFKPHYQDKREITDFVAVKGKIIVSEDGEFTSDATAFNRRAILIKGLLNYDFDIQKTLKDLKTKLSRTDRLVVITYNSYFSFFYKLANILRFRKADIPTTFITYTDLDNITKLAGYEMTRVRPVGHMPFHLLGLGSIINYILPALPFFRWFSFACIITIRPKPDINAVKPSLTVVIPARNEKGNIENALKRMPDLGCKLEIIFVEGNSSDGTWEEIQRVSQVYRDRFDIKCFQQTGKGKGDAVRFGFLKAQSDLLTILDADLTMPPEMLGRFYSAFTDGLADFINGTRLVYPMEGEAMRFLNFLGNKFFAMALSFVLDTKLGDSLCGTKLMLRKDYKRFTDWRTDFGDFDPFGDFGLLFPAAIMGLGTVDIPIRYLARTYGTTNIHRFRHGFMLLKMTMIGLFRVKCRT